MEDILKNPPIVTAANTYTIVHGDKGDIALVAWGDRLIIEEDKFKSGFECKTCDGDGHTDEVCPVCQGSKIELFDNVPTRCRACTVGTRDGRESYGYKLCPDCKGKGGLIITPETSQLRPSTGVIRSTGPDVKFAKVGDHVLYSNMAGHAIHFKQKVVIRTMREHEVTTLIFGAGKIQEQLI